MSKNYLITGAARGIGRGLSRLLLAKGHRVLLVDNNELELEHMRSKVLASTAKSHWDVLHADLSQPASIQRVAEHAQTFFNGHLDVLVNNAAYTAGVGGAAFENLALDTWTQSVAVNLTAPMLLSQACLSMLRSPESAEQTGNVMGSIVNMSSTRARQSEPNSEPYAATKAGLIGLTHAMAASLAAGADADVKGVSVNAILPGWIAVSHESKEGDEAREAGKKGGRWEDELSAEDQRWHFTGRVGQVEDILKAVEYLVDAKDFVTGTELVVDGGVTRRMVYPE